MTTQSAYETLAHPLLARQPRSDAEWSEYNRVLMRGVLANLSDAGRISSSAALPQSVIGARPSVQLVGALTAVDDSGTPRIDIAAHSVTYDFGDISYNSGSVFVADFVMVYYVFAFDPTFEGGAVTYVAFDSPEDGVSPDYRYVGAIETPAFGGGGTSGGFGGASGTGTSPGTGQAWP